MNRVLDRQKRLEAKIGTRLGHIYGDDHHEAVKYTKEENERQRYDANKRELIEKLKDVRMTDEMMEDLHRYTRLDHFHAGTYLKELQYDKPRFRWCGPDSYTANEKAQALAKYFDDPSRVPKYD